jgi:hypothetical protein
MSTIAENALKAGIPDYMVGGIERWIEHGIYPGDFLTAVIENDLREACGRADDTNQKLLYQYVSFFYNHAPSRCWGSPEKCEAWSNEKTATLREAAAT